jgi:hypothetical protein
VISEAEEIASSESSDQEIVDVAGQNDGQLLKKVVADPTKGTSEFEFDHRTAIQPQPWHEGNDEQRMLFMPSGGRRFHISCRRALQPGSKNEASADQDWQAL